MHPLMWVVGINWNCGCALFRTIMTQLLEDDCFKEEFKRYKKKDADLNDVIDFTRSQGYEKEQLIQAYGVVTGSSNSATQLGLLPPSQWKIYALTSTPGLMVIPNPFLEGCQHRWVRRCIVDYPCKPNMCNLDAHMVREGAGQLWPGEDRGGSLQSVKESLFYKLRWVTLGYHYDWNTKEYYEDQRSPFPPDLAKLSSFILEVAGFPDFLAEAAIVNFYHLDSTLSGHTDHSERNLSLPLLSISFGQSAVFLIGGETKSVRPQAIVLHSGDVVVMSGQSRVAYHGVPKIITPSASTPVPESLNRCTLLDCAQRFALIQQDGLADSTCHVCGRERRWASVTKHAVVKDVFNSPLKDTSPAGMSASPTSADLSVSPAKRLKRASVDICCSELVREWTHFEKYLSTSRININVRQVN